MRLASACTLDGYSQYWRILVAPHEESEEQCARSKSSWFSEGIKVDNIKLPWSSECGAVQAYQVLAQLDFLEGSHCLQNRSPPLPKSLMRRPVSKSHQLQRCSSPGLHVWYFFVVSVRTTARTSGTACAEGSNCLHAHIMSNTSQDSSGRHWQPSLKVDSRGCPRLKFMGIRPSLW